MMAFQIIRIIAQRTDRSYFIAFGIAALIILWPLTLHPTSAPARPAEWASDFLLTHLPNANFIRYSLKTYGQIPLWNPQILAGQSFVADPQAGLWYPPYFLLLILPPPLAFNILLIAHIAWLGFGMFQMLKAEGLPQAASFFGGLLMAGTPNLIAHVGAGHITFVFALAWLPWVLQQARKLACHVRMRQAASLGCMLAFIALLHLQLSLYSILLSSAYCFTYWVSRRRSGEDRADLHKLIIGGLSSMLFMIALSAVLLLPFLEFVQISPRADLTLEEAGAYSLPPHPYLLGMIVPLYGVVHEWVTYFGVFTIALALLGMFRRQWFWGILVALCILFALGLNGPLFPFFFRYMPGFAFLRAPARMWFLVALGINALAAHGLTKLSESILPKIRGVDPFSKRTFADNLILSALCVAAFTEILIMNATQLTSRPIPSPSPAAAWIADQPGLFRVFSPSSSLPQPDSLQHLEGVSPVHLGNVSEYVSRASRIPIEGYSVSVPATWVEGTNPDPQLVQLASMPDANLLGLLNVAFVASEFPLHSPGLELVRTFDDTKVYRNTLAQPRAWMEAGSAKILYWSPNRIEITTEGSGRLILSEISYPGWKAWVDGKPVTIETVYGLLRSVTLLPGSHQVVFSFRPTTFYIGLALTLTGLISFIGIWIWRRYINL